MKSQLNKIAFDQFYVTVRAVNLTEQLLQCAEMELVPQGVQSICADVSSGL